MTFLEFMTEGKALDPSLAGAASIRQTGEGGRKYPSRKKSEGERKRMKAVGGGKMVPAGSYKDRKDIGSTKAGVRENNNQRKLEVVQLMHRRQQQRQRERRQH